MSKFLRPCFSCERNIKIQDLVICRACRNGYHQECCGFPTDVHLDESRIACEGWRCILCLYNQTNGGNHVSNTYYFQINANDKATADITMLKEEDRLPSSYSLNMDIFNLSGSLPDFVISDIDETLELASMPVVLQQEDTLDVAHLDTLNVNNYRPISRRGAPQRHVFPGHLDFQVEINAAHTRKNKYLFSNKLNRIYVHMKRDFSVQFRWNYNQAPQPLFVRATTVFSDESQAEKRVERCTQHTHDTTQKGMDLNVIKNVLHSSRDNSVPGVYYCGNPDQADSWYSVVVEFPDTSVGPCTHAYQFVCKNSCSSGINRRATDIIFELEDFAGNILGRQTVGARACSCPRRDMVRDEGVGQEEGEGEGEGEAEGEGVRKKSKKRVAANGVNKAKKIKIEAVGDTDDEVITLQSVEVVGVKTAKLMLCAALGAMVFDAARKCDDPQAQEKYNKAIFNLKAQLEQFENAKPA